MKSHRALNSDASDNPLHGTPPTISAAGSINTPEERRCLQPPQKKKTSKIFTEQLGHVQKELTTCATTKDIDENFAATLVDHVRTVKTELKLDMQL